MTYPSAYHGVRRLFGAHLLVLIGVILILGAFVFIMFSQGFVTDKGIDAEAMQAFFENEENYSKIIAPGMFMIIGLILLLAACVMLIVGLVKAGRDEPAFRTALWILVACLVVTAVLSVVANNKPDLAIQPFSDIISTVTGLLVEFFIAVGVMNLATKLDDAAMYNRGKPIKMLYCIAICIAVVTFLCGLFIKNEGVLNVVQYVDYAANLIVFVAFIMMLVYLGKAKKMLRIK